MYIYFFFCKETQGTQKLKAFLFFFATLAFLQKTCTEVQIWKQIVLGSLHLFSEPKKGQTFRNTATTSRTTIMIISHSWQQCSLCGAIELRSWQLCVTVCWHFAKHTFIPLWTRTLLVSYIPTIVSLQYFISLKKNKCLSVKTDPKAHPRNKGGFTLSKYIEQFYCHNKSTTETIFQRSFSINVSVYQCFYFFVIGVFHYVF